MLLKRMLASTIVGMMLLSPVQFAFASEATIDISDNQSIDIEKIEKESEEIINSIGIEDLSVQLNDLYHEVGKQLNIDYIYVKILHLLAGGKAVYADKRPNIYSELTVDSVNAPFDIKGASQKYSLQAYWVYCPDEEIERPNKYYIPDAAYSVTSEVVKLMNQRYFIDRGQMKPYFDALSMDVKTNIIFCEAVMEYIGSSREAIESFYPNYEKILYEKGKNENVVESNGEGVFKIKDEFKSILVDNNISSERDLEVLALILSFDSKLAASSDPDAIKETYVTPYTKNYTSRENMMLAAMSVVGKVRYVWGGGHGTTGAIDGINPAWQAFYEAYPSTDGTEGYGMCIKPTSSWCPIHGIVENSNGCLLMADTVYNVEDYVDSRKEVMDTQNMEGEKYKDLIESSTQIERGMNSHRLDGLDCSGFASWVYNQITNNRNYDAGAKSFISAGGLKVIPYGNRMLPGDVFSWGSHIVVVIGPSRVGGNAYVMVEASPNTVKFGVIYYSSVNSADLTNAIKIATEANDLIGGLPLTERTHIYNMDSVGYEEVEIEGNSQEVSEDIQESNQTKLLRYAEIGRLPYSFRDENITIPGYGKKIKDMNAQEIIQYTLDNLMPQYITGLDSYKGEVYNIDKFKDLWLEADILNKNEEVMDSVQTNRIEKPELLIIDSDNINV